MKDAYEVLYRKEADIARVRQEVESLKIAATLLAENDLSFFPPETTPDTESKKPVEGIIAEPATLEPTGTATPSPIAGSMGFWGSLRSRRHQGRR